MHAPQEETERWVFLLLSPQGSVAVQTVAFVLQSPQPSTLSCQCLDLGKTETSPSGSLWKRLNVGCMFLSSLSLPREKLRIWELSPNCHTVLGGGIMCTSLKHYFCSKQSLICGA